MNKDLKGAKMEFGGIEGMCERAPAPPNKTAKIKDDEDVMDIL